MTRKYRICKLVNGFGVEIWRAEAHDDDRPSAGWITLMSPAKHSHDYDVNEFMSEARALEVVRLDKAYFVKAKAAAEELAKAKRREVVEYTYIP